MIYRGLFSRRNPKYYTIAWTSTPIYVGSTLVGRDLNEGGWYRTTADPDGSFSYTAEDAAGKPYAATGFRSRAGAARVAAMRITKEKREGREALPSKS